MPRQIITFSFFKIFDKIFDYIAEQKFFLNFLILQPNTHLKILDEKNFPNKIKYAYIIKEISTTHLMAIFP